MRGVALFASLLLLVIGSPTYAQETTGTRIPVGAAVPRGEGAAGARQTLRDFGACVVRQRHNRVERVFAMAANTAEYITELRRLAMNVCLAHSEMRMSNLLMRGSLFEAMLDVYHQNFRPTDLSAIPLIAYRAMHPGNMSEEALTIVALNDFADCVVRALPDAARELLLTPPGSERETTIIAQLTPQLPPCVPVGATIALSRSVVRGAIAEVLYRYATLPSAISATTNPAGTHD